MTTTTCYECGGSAGADSVFDMDIEYCRPCAEKLDLIYEPPTLRYRGAGRWSAEPYDTTGAEAYDHKEDR